MRSRTATTDANAIGEHLNLASDYEKVLQTLRLPLSQRKEEYKDFCCHLPSSIQAYNRGWVRGISLKWGWNENIFVGNFFLICSFSCKTQNARVRDNVVAGTISAGWLRVLRREADLNLKTHWGEEMVWLHLVRLASWVYTWVNKKIPLFMSAGLARHHGRGMEVFISQGPPHRATMSIGMRQVFGS